MKKQNAWVNGRTVSHWGHLDWRGNLSPAVCGSWAHQRDDRDETLPACRTCRIILIDALEDARDPNG